MRGKDRKSTHGHFLVISRRFGRLRLALSPRLSGRVRRSPYAPRDCASSLRCRSSSSTVSASRRSIIAASSRLLLQTPPDRPAAPHTPLSSSFCARWPLFRDRAKFRPPPPELICGPKFGECRYASWPRAPTVHAADCGVFGFTFCLGCFRVGDLW